MKAIILAMMLLAFAFAQSQALIDCIEEKCPDESAKCKKTSGCEDKLYKCVKKCGEKVAQTCYALCLGVSGPSVDVCLCAVNKKCITNVSKADVVALNLIGAIETYL